MKKFGIFSALTAITALALTAGCKKESTPAPVAVPTVTAEKPAAAPGELPSGHPPMDGAAAEAAAAPSVPAGHPPIGNVAPAPVPGTPTTAEGIAFEAPTEWQVKPTRTMLWKVFGAPKVDGDTDDGEITISSLAANIPLDANVERWCGQFELVGNKPCKDVAKIRDLKGTAFPSKVIEIEGGLKSAGMGAAPGPVKPGWRLIVVEVTTPGKAWYLKFTGPGKTVAKREPAFLKAASAIK